MARALQSKNCRMEDCLVCVNTCCPFMYLLQKDAERWVGLQLLRQLTTRRPNPELLESPRSQQGAGWVRGFVVCGGQWGVLPRGGRTSLTGTGVCRSWRGAVVGCVPLGVLGRSAALPKGGGESPAGMLSPQPLLMGFCRAKIKHVASGRRIGDSKQ